MTLHLKSFKMITIREAKTLKGKHQIVRANKTSNATSGGALVETWARDCKRARGRLQERVPARQAGVSAASRYARAVEL